MRQANGKGSIGSMLASIIRQRSHIVSSRKNQESTMKFSLVTLAAALYSADAFTATVSYDRICEKRKTIGRLVDMGEYDIFSGKASKEFS